MKTSLLLGWPTHSDAKRHAEVNNINSLMQEQHQDDLSYAIQYEGDGHLVTFAPTGSGKGVSAIIPNLLHYRGPCIVIDPKGENFAVTAKHRKMLGQRIGLLDPFNSVPDLHLKRNAVERDRLNPLDLCKLSGNTLENDAEMLASLLSADGSLGSDPFWDISARRLIAGLIAHEMQRSQTSSSASHLGQIVNRLYSDDPVYSLAVMLDKENPSPYVSKAIGGGFLAIADKTRDGILSTAQSYLSTIMSGGVGAYIKDSTIDIRDVQTREDYTIYIVIPPTKLKSHSFLLKVWVGMLMHSVMERKTVPKSRTLFILDECANLGELDVLRKAVTLLRGYGLQVWMFFQDLSQMERLYATDYRTMINNCGVLQTFGINRLSSASPLAKVIGEYEEDDLLNLDRTQQILSIAPSRVRVARLIKYYKDRAFSGRFDLNPMIRPAGVDPARRTSRLIQHKTNSHLR
jgi:type IV secretion system protein VirD4